MFPNITHKKIYVWAGRVCACVRMYAFVCVWVCFSIKSKKIAKQFLWSKNKVAKDHWKYLTCIDPNSNFASKKKKKGNAKILLQKNENEKTTEKKRKKNP